MVQDIGTFVVASDVRQMRLRSTGSPVGVA